MKAGVPEIPNQRPLPPLAGVFLLPLEGPFPFQFLRVSGLRALRGVVLDPLPGTGFLVSQRLQTSRLA